MGPSAPCGAFAEPRPLRRCFRTRLAEVVVENLELTGSTERPASRVPTSRLGSTIAELTESVR